MRNLLIFFFCLVGWMGNPSNANAALSVDLASFAHESSAEARPKPMRTYRGFRVKRQKRKAASGRSNNSHLLQSHCSKGKGRKR
ncbi:MAG: hypothetical protein ACFCUH_11735 [Flavobacteriales bacterium]